VPSDPALQPQLLDCSPVTSRARVYLGYLCGYFFAHNSGWVARVSGTPSNSFECQCVSMREGRVLNHEEQKLRGVSIERPRCQQSRKRTSGGREVTETIIQGRRRGARRCIHACNHEGWRTCRGPSDGAQEAAEHMLLKHVRAAWCPLACGELTLSTGPGCFRF
jgi:hypothetical protein